MSGLEPVAALGLACNILQVIGTGIGIARVAKQVYQDGNLDLTLTERARILDDLSSRIRSTTTVASTAKPKAQEKQLLDLAEKCQRASRALCEEVDFLNGPPTKAKLSGAIRTALMTRWRKKRLVKLEQQLEEAESLLQTGLLKTILEQSNNDLSSLDADLKAFIVEYREGHAKATDLMKKHITAEIEKNQKATELHVTQKVSEAESSLKSHIGVAIRGVTRHEQDAQIQNKRDRLLRSLKFDRMNERRNQVTSAHHDTFTWMLRDGSDVEGSQRPTEIFDDEYSSSSQDSDDSWELAHAGISWDSFSDWLRSTASVYWISGKPGSGKTTLMKYILDQPQTQTYLNQWKPDAIIISHFFWRPGTVMQQSIKGLMSSLLHQLLLGEPGVIDHVLRSTADMPRKDSETDWSIQELQETLHHVISRYPRPVAIFLDGLDEVLPKDGVTRLLDIVDQLRQPCGHTEKTKLCLGSRPETLLYKHLCGFPQLRLEQLNHVDLWKYGNDHVVIPCDYLIEIPYKNGRYYPVVDYTRETPPSRDEFREWLVWTLVTKAEGVFLWLCLTVTTVTKALNQDETFEDLEARIRSLPSDLAELYADMWNRMNNDDSHLRVRAASYLQLALAQTGDDFEFPLNLFTMMVSTTPEKAEILLQPDPSQRTSVTSLMEACERTRRDTMNRCAGLLVCPSPSEVHSTMSDCLYPWYGEEYDKLIPYVSDVPGYSFLHRTARDFLMDTEAGQGILICGKFPGSLSRLKLLEARLAICQLFRSPILRVVRGKYIHASVCSSDISNLFVELWRRSRMQDDASTRQEVSRLLFLFEQLFNHGQLFGRSEVPPNTMQFENGPRHPGYYVSYDISVRGQHEFLIEAAYSCHDSRSWSHLLPFIKDRHLDENTKCRLLVHACTFRENVSDLFIGMEMDYRLDSIQNLLGRGASPYHQSVNRTDAIDLESPLIMIAETPFKALMMSIWTAATNWVIENNLRRKLFELICIFITNGADPHEEIHVAVMVKDGRIEFVDLWLTFYEPETEESPEGSLTGFGRIIIIVAYPASALLANILQIWKVEDHSQVDWVPKICEVPESGVGKGRPISVVELGHVSIKEGWLFTPPLFLSTGIFNTRQEAGMEKHFLGLIRLAEDSLQGVVAEGNKHFCEYSGGCLSHVSVPLEIQAEMTAGLERLRTTNVPVTERRKELRRILGVITPLEEPEWQNNTDRLPSSQFVLRTPPSEDGSSKEEGSENE